MRHFASGPVRGSVLNYVRIETPRRLTKRGANKERNIGEGNNKDAQMPIQVLKLKVVEAVSSGQHTRVEIQSCRKLDHISLRSSRGQSPQPLPALDVVGSLLASSSPKKGRLKDYLGYLTK